MIFVPDRSGIEQPGLSTGFNSGVVCCPLIIASEEGSPEVPVMGGELSISRSIPNKPKKPVQFCVEVVHVMEHQRFGNHRPLRRTPFELSLMTEDHMLEKQEQVWREARDAGCLLSKKVAPEHDMANQLPGGGV